MCQSTMLKSIRGETESQELVSVSCFSIIESNLLFLFPWPLIIINFMCFQIKRLSVDVNQQLFINRYGLWCSALMLVNFTSIKSILANEWNEHLIGMNKNILQIKVQCIPHNNSECTDWVDCLVCRTLQWII